MKLIPGLPFEFMGIGLYKSLTFIGIGIGIWLLMRGIGGKTLWPIILLFLGLFITIKELMDMMHYTSPMNLAGVGVGLLVLVLGIAGVTLPTLVVAVLGAFMAGKEVMDMMHSG